jgi:hypothetical protein
MMADFAEIDKELVQRRAYKLRDSGWLVGSVDTGFSNNRIDDKAE